MPSPSLAIGPAATEKRRRRRGRSTVPWRVLAAFPLALVTTSGLAVASDAARLEAPQSVSRFDVAEFTVRIEGRSRRESIHGCRFDR